MKAMVIISQYNELGSKEDSLVSYLRVVNQSPRKNTTENLDDQKSSLEADD